MDDLVTSARALLRNKDLLSQMKSLANSTIEEIDSQERVLREYDSLFNALNARK